MIPQVHKIIILNWHTLYLVSNKLVYNDSFSIFDVQILHPFFLISQKNIPNVGILLRCIPLTIFQLRWTITHFVNLGNSSMHTRTSVAVWSFFYQRFENQFEKSIHSAFNFDVPRQNWRNLSTTRAATQSISSTFNRSVRYCKQKLKTSGKKLPKFFLLVCETVKRKDCIDKVNNACGKSRWLLATVLV